MAKRYYDGNDWIGSDLTDFGYVALAILIAGAVVAALLKMYGG